MKRDIFLILLCAFAGVTQVFAQGFDKTDIPWYRDALTQEEPNSLSYYTSISEQCVNEAEDLGAEELDRIVNGVITRSRIKPVPVLSEEGISKEHDPNSVVLFVYAACFESKINTTKLGYTYNVQIAFGKFASGVSVHQFSGHYYDYGTFGNSPGTEGITDTIKSGTERAIEDYLRVNFDL